MNRIAGLSLDEYVSLMAQMSGVSSVEEMLQGIDEMQVESDPYAGLGHEYFIETDEFIYDTEGEKKRIAPKAKGTTAFCNTMHIVGLENMMYDAVDEFAPYGEQQRALSSIADFVYEQERCELVFPPDLSEPFTQQFNNTTGVCTTNGLVVSANAVHNIIYGARYEEKGNPFVVFAIRRGMRHVHVYWDHETIEIVEGFGICRGIVSEDTMYISDGVMPQFSEFHKRKLVKSRYYYLTQGFLEERPENTNIILSISGVDYCCQAKRLVVLQRKDNTMVDSDMKQYAVNILAKGNAFYNIQHGAFHFFCNTNTFADNTAAVKIQRDNVITCDELSDILIIPRGEAVLCPKYISVKLCEKRIDYIRALNNNVTPFMVRDEGGTSRNAAIMREVRATGRVLFSQIPALYTSPYGVFISNNFFRAGSMVSARVFCAGVYTIKNRRVFKFTLMDTSCTDSYYRTVKGKYQKTKKSAVLTASCKREGFKIITFHGRDIEECLKEIKRIRDKKDADLKSCENDYVNRKDLHY